MRVVIAVVVEHLKRFRGTGRSEYMTYAELKQLLDGYGCADLYEVVLRMVRKGLVKKVYSEIHKQKMVCLAEDKARKAIEIPSNRKDCIVTLKRCLGLEI